MKKKNNVRIKALVRRLFLNKVGIIQRTEVIFLETVKSLSINDIYTISAGIIMGTIARFVTIKVDFRQIPTYPSAYFNNIIFGLIASALGAIAIPAVLAEDFTAITFLALAVTQFREFRTAERDSLAELDSTEYTKRGDAYIDGISKTYESRYYISLVTAVLTVLVIKLLNLPNIWLNIGCGIAVGFLIMFICYRFTKGKTVDQICEIKAGDISVQGSHLYVDGIFVTNYLGTALSRKMFINEGLAIVLSPREEKNGVTLENLGQRQAILFEAASSVGVKKYCFMNLDYPSGKVLIALVPINHDPDKLIKAARETPLLENSRKAKQIMKTNIGGTNV